ncbi:MAG: glycerol kinase GlpK [Peptococcaceae bacterium]|nr:glycerol kinase GlpK [Peptococcaceae bacterium]
MENKQDIKQKYIVALDQGTTSSRAIVFDHEQNIVSVGQKEFSQIYPQPGWVEHDPMEIWATQYGVLQEALIKAGITMADVAGVGITNQRETTIVWEKDTGKPIYNAIVWQCRRTADLCDKLKEEGWADYIQSTTGLVIDAYFSATKISWILDHVPGARERAEKGELLFGTVDSWLVWNLTGGKVHVTDYTNASRTMLYNIRELKWDDKLLECLNIPKAMLPKVRNSSEIYGYIGTGDMQIPIAGIAGDQQAALFGQACFERGSAKNTYGTGCFLLMNIGKQFIQSGQGLITTIAATMNDDVEYALEGSIFVGGAVIQWLRDELRLIETAAESEEYALELTDNGGVYLVPAFTGLGAPHWDMYARGSIFGLTRGTGRSHIVRAALEAIAYQTNDVLQAMVEDSGLSLTELKVDGGACQNNFLMQFQADIMNCEVRRPAITETTALGVAYLAGLAVGYWESKDEIAKRWHEQQHFSSQMEQSVREANCAGWKKAVGRAMNWAE